jgi:hypothetical protein
MQNIDKTLEQSKNNLCREKVEKNIEDVKLLFQQRMESNLESDFITLEGPMTVQQVHNKINELMDLHAKL